MDILAVHDQATFVDQGCPSFRSPYGRHQQPVRRRAKSQDFRSDAVDQCEAVAGCRVLGQSGDRPGASASTAPAAGFLSAESYKLGSACPYARLQRAFLRRTINLGGDTEKIDDDFYQLAGMCSTDRLVLTVRRFASEPISTPIPRVRGSILQAELMSETDLLVIGTLLRPRGTRRHALRPPLRERCRAWLKRRRSMWKNLLAVTVAIGVSVAVTGAADAQRLGMGTSGHGMASAHTGFSTTSRMSPIATRGPMMARAQVRGPSFRPPGWSHGRKVGWHCRVGTRGCIPPGLR
jgi:hypothetical protein